MLIQCPEMYRLRKIKKVPETMGVDRFVGIVDHDTHAANLKQKIGSSEDFEAEKMRGIYLNRWDKTILEEGEPEWEGLPDNTKDLGLLMMETYHAQVSPRVQPIRVEERFEQRFKGLPIPVVGYPDVETHSMIVERKTTKTKLSKPKSKWVMQGRIYSLVYDKPVEYQIVTKQKTPQVVTALEEPAMFLEPDHHAATLALLNQAMFMLNDFWVRFGPDQPWPTTGIYHDWLCSYCFAGPKYGNYCVAWKGRNHDQVPN